MSLGRVFSDQSPLDGKNHGKLVGGLVQSNKMVVLWDLMGFNQQEMVIWVGVWNIWFFSIYWECHHPN
jgi:hypothetical protein